VSPVLSRLILTFFVKKTSRVAQHTKLRIQISKSRATSVPIHPVSLQSGADTWFQVHPRQQLPFVIVAVVEIECPEIAS